MNRLGYLYSFSVHNLQFPVYDVGDESGLRVKIPPFKIVNLSRRRSRKPKHKRYHILHPTIGGEADLRASREPRPFTEGQDEHGG